MISKNGLMKNNIKWGGSGIEKILFDYILENIEIGSNIIELGSGYISTRVFSEYYNVYSVDDNQIYQNLFDNVNYIYAENKNGWYDREILINKLPHKYSLVFVDGPSGEGQRNGILNNLDIFRSESVFIFHDTYRESEKKLSIEVANKLGKNITFHTEGDFWSVLI